MGGSEQRKLGWSLLGNVQLRQEIMEKTPDYSRIKQLVTASYQTETGIEAPVEQSVSSWMTWALRANPGLVEELANSSLPPWPVIFPNLALKYAYIIRRPCLLCMPYQKIRTMGFHLHTPPVSRQVDRQAAFKLAIQAYLNSVNHDFTDYYNARLCMAILFVTRTSARRTDIDNMAKTLLDAMQGYAYANDEQVDHLDLLRLASGSDESFIGIRLAVTEVAQNIDVVCPEFDVAWIPTEGVAQIDLTPYLNETESNGFATPQAEV